MKLSMIAAAAKTLALSFAMIAAVAVSQVEVRADEVTVAGSAAGTLSGMTGGLSYSGSTFSETTSNGFAALGGNPAPGANVNNLGSFTLANQGMVYNGGFTLNVMFTQPTGITGGGMATYTASVIGSVTNTVDANGNANGGVFVNFGADNTRTFTFANADATGTFSLQVNNVSVNPGLTASITANIVGQQVGAEPVPEPATLLLLGTGLTGVAGAARRRMKQGRKAE